MKVDIFKIAGDAVKSSLEYKDTINASIGMFYDEEKTIGGMPSVLNAIKNLEAKQLLPYPPVTGDAEYKRKLISWIFKDYEVDIKSKMFVEIGASLGGSGAIASTFSIYGQPGEEILVSDVRWEYDRFANRAHLKIFEHELFDGDEFNIKSFKTRLKELCVRQKRVIVIINDPCHNPTGYTLTLEEWRQILLTLNEFKNNEIVFLYDISYIEYSSEDDTREKMSLLPLLNNNVLTIIAFSGSKTFGIYGMRMGAAMALSTNEEKVKDFALKFHREARGCWSAPVIASLELFKAMCEPVNKLSFDKDLQRIKDIMLKRGNLFKDQANEVGLKTHPFKSGFYTIVIVDNPEEAYFKLAEQRIFAVPMITGIRFALCSLSIKEIEGLPQRIKKILYK
jgi:aromatic-amino-acid transaminase